MGFWTPSCLDSHPALAMLTGGHRCAGTHQPRLLALTHPPPFPTHPGSDLDNPYTRSSLWSQAPSPSLPVRDLCDGPTTFQLSLLPEPWCSRGFFFPALALACLRPRRAKRTLSSSLSLCASFSDPPCHPSLLFCSPPPSLMRTAPIFALPAALLSLQFEIPVLANRPHF